MKYFGLLAMILVTITLQSGSAYAVEFDMTALQNLRDTNPTNFKKAANSTLEAAMFTSHRGFNRSKVPGPYRFFIETAGTIYDTNDSQTAFVTTSRGSPDSFKGISLKGGVGLPYGFAVDLGASHLIRSVDLASVFGNVSFQYLDLSNVVFTDLVPSAAINLGFNYFVSGLDGYGFQTQAIFGGYHREWLAQVGYALQFTYGALTGLNPSFSKTSLRHGVGSQWGIFEGLYFRQDIYILPIEASFTMGYQF